ncbi:esterase FE4-like [Planococcus citri]|uniref:esterase FE4-like n=1 Tax=Planococcus citri TaxID=170843 RepID=UPI0031F7A92A
MTEKVTVTVKEGRVRGFKAKTPYSGAEYYNFLGIPYAQSTAGSARYKDPVKVKPWSNILDATAPKDGCMQFSLQTRDIRGSEDCLYNNIYTPQLPSKGSPLKAVMVNLHPGGFFHGSPDPWYYGAPEFIMHHDVIYVCVGFRLHVLGYLNLHMKVCSGNQALKDVILSLKWIKENISAFGGDPDNITLMGSSSGSALVHFMLLSPMARGLYHKAILMGMYVFSPVIVFFDDHVTTAYELAEMMGYDGLRGENKKLLSFYRTLEFQHFATARPEHFYVRSTLQVYPASPFMCTPEPGENSPLQISPRKLIPSTNRVPVIIGFCEKEAAMSLAMLRMFKKPINDSFYKAIRQNPWCWGAALNDDELKLVQREVENFYLDGKPIENASQSTLCDIITDIALSDVYDTLINVISADLPSSVYVYNFLYDGKLCTMKAKLANLLEKELKGAFHAADYSYWNYAAEFAGKTMANIQPKDRLTIDRMTSLFTSFAKTSNPNYDGLEVDWKPTTADHPSHLIINESLQVEDKLLNGERMEFWHKLKNKFAKHTNNL